MQPIFIAGDSPLHRWHPLTKLAMTFFLISATSLLPWSYVGLIVCLTVVLLSSIAGVTRRLFRAALIFLLPIAFSLFLIQGILFPPVKVTPLVLGPITLWREGLIFALVSCIRILALMSSVMLLFQTTHPADLAFALTERGLPNSIGYILLVALQLVPDMSARATAILETLESRAYTATCPKTSLRRLTDSNGQRLARLILLLGILGLIVFRIAQIFM